MTHHGVAPDAAGIPGGRNWQHDTVCRLGVS